ncbi:HAD family hydrolase [Paenibacillus sp. OV219]|uniref:HAD family hydrolase n=1 Tax=Paenibacillus sp. OV219 TaxID=1884377 RepID=UPI0015A71837|nr:HAD-IA family hydrolase [Paenibacillus sp. OV219]
MNSYKVKGIIFDMDNTILRSKINFSAMKAEISQYLLDNRLLHENFPVNDHTTSTIIEHVQRSEHWDIHLQEILWDIAKKHELMGMSGADLEPGAREILLELHGKFKMVILTNNSYTAAMSALLNHRINPFFETVIGREQMKFMKPAPDGVYAILNKYPNHSADDWISVGDAWIDGKASQDAGVKFISYQGDIDRMRSKGVIPIASIDDLAQLASYIRRV